MRRENPDIWPLLITDSNSGQEYLITREDFALLIAIAAEQNPHDDSWSPDARALIEHLKR